MPSRIPHAQHEFVESSQDTAPVFGTKNMGKFHHDLTVLPSPGIVVYFREIIPFYGPTIQVSEIL